MSDGKQFNVLFLCTKNSARSIMAEAIINRLGTGKFHGYSAGSQPGDAVNPHVIELLEQLNYLTGDFFAKSWDAFAKPDAPHLDFVFTVCDTAAQEVCPVWPGQPMTAHWGVPDPVLVTGNDIEKRLAFSEAYRMLYNRISIFVNLPISSLDQLSLQKRLDEIGKTVDGPSSDATAA